MFSFRNKKKFQNYSQNPIDLELCITKLLDITKLLESQD